MKKIKILFIILVLIIILLTILIKNNIILLNTGYIDEIYYSSIEKNKNDKPKIDSGMAQVKRWNELSLCEKFSEAAIQNSLYYNCNTTPISDSFINIFLEEITLKSLDYSNSQTYFYTNASVYSIKNISSDVAIALKFKDSTEYYTYINSMCSPLNFSDLINNFKFEEYLTLHSINYIKKNFNNTVNLNISNISSTDFKNILFNNTNINILDYYENLDTDYFEIISISDIYGYAFKFYLTNDGNLIIDIPCIKKKLNTYINSTDLFINNIKEKYSAQAKVTYFNPF